MESITRYRQLFEYDRWGNQAALASLSGCSGPAEKAFKACCHIVGGHRVWRARFDNPNPPNAQPWPALTLEECRAGIDDIYQSWMLLFDSFRDEKLKEKLVYRTTQGVEFQTPIGDVLMHLLLHSAYHRGQVAAAVREAGGKPAVTDYAVYLRQKK